MSRATQVRPAAPADLAAARAWLADAGLPVADLTPDHMQDFLVAAEEGRVIGMIGLEQFGSIGLLRSLVVDPAARSSGIGRQLVDALETRASRAGVTELWLLTTDADRYFTRLGYTETAREIAPAAIKETAEFSSLCPGDAVLMKKAL